MIVLCATCDKFLYRTPSPNGDADPKSHGICRFDELVTYESNNMITLNEKKELAMMRLRRKNGLS